MDDLTKLVKHEQEQLRQRRAAIDARLAELDAFLRVLPTLVVPGPSADVAVTLTGMRAAVSTGTMTPAVTTIKDRIIEHCEQVLSDGKPRHTRELLASLNAHGIELNGKDPVLQASAVLSREKDKFRASRSIGWTLVSAQKGESPGASTPEPSDSRQLPLNAADGQPQP